MNISHHALMQAAGLDEHELELYAVLVQLGESLVPDILEQTSLSRGTVYSVLGTLVAKGLIKYRKKGRNAYYAPAHPTTLFNLLQDKKRERVVIDEEAHLAIEQLTEEYNMTTRRPGVRFYIGDEKAKEIFLESANAKQTVYSITNRDAFERVSAQLIAEAMNARKDCAVRERVLVLDGPKGRELAEIAKIDQSLEVKILPTSSHPFDAGMDMYDGKIIYGTHKNHETITAIIEDPELCAMQRSIFEALWNVL